MNTLLLLISIFSLCFENEQRLITPSYTNTVALHADKVDKKLGKIKTKQQSKLQRKIRKARHGSLLFALLIILFFSAIAGTGIMLLINLLLGSPMSFWIAFGVGFILGGLIFLLFLLGS